MLDEPRKGPITGRELMADLETRSQVSLMVRVMVQLALWSMAEDLRARAHTMTDETGVAALYAAADLVDPSPKT